MALKATFMRQSRSSHVARRAAMAVAVAVAEVMGKDELTESRRTRPVRKHGASTDYLDRVDI